MTYKTSITVPDEWTLRRQARQLADAYATLIELSETPPRPNHVRKMKPMFRSQSPTNDSDHTFNLIHELLRDTPDPNVPGGFRSMACDALSYTTATGYAHDVQPGILCAHIAFHAHTIADNFPATEELMELMEKQEDYIRRDINKRFGGPAQIQRELANVRPTGYGTAADIAPLVSAAVGRTVTRKTIRYWGLSGRIEQRLTDDGTMYYSLAEACEAAQNYVDKRRSTR